MTKTIGSGSEEPGEQLGLTPAYRVRDGRAAGDVSAGAHFHPAAADDCRVDDTENSSVMSSR